jgi:hypothetical protein
MYREDEIESFFKFKKRKHTPLEDKERKGTPISLER